jgi:hypothetical protein
VRDCGDVAASSDRGEGDIFGERRGARRVQKPADGIGKGAGEGGCGYGGISGLVGARPSNVTVPMRQKKAARSSVLGILVFLFIMKYYLNS